MRSLDAVTVPLSGRHLIEASAGTGKTFTITTLALRLVVEEQLRPDQILVVTYTRAATAELRERIRRRMQQALAYLDTPFDDPVLDELVPRWRDPARARDLLQNAIADFDLAPISTIHAFCQRALREHAFESGTPFDVELSQDTTPYVRQVAQDLWTTLTWQHPRPFLEWLGSQVDMRQVQRLVRLGIQAAPLQVLPETTVDPGELEAASDAVQKAFRDARQAWLDTGADVADLVDRAKGLSGSSYRASYTRSRVKTLDAAFQQRHGPFGVPDVEKALDYFHPDTMAAKRNKAATEADTPVPSHPTIDRLAALRDAMARSDDAFVRERVRLCRAVVDASRAAMDRITEPDGHLRFFDDLLGDLAAALEADGGDRLAAAIRAQMPAALIDEFQDTDPVQWRIFQRVYPQGDDGSRLFLIGDPKQAIYGFRGADLAAYLGAREEVPEDARWSLDTNWRSDRRLVDACNLVFDRAREPFADPRIAFVPVKAHHPDSRITIDGEVPAALRLRWHPPRGGKGAWGILADHRPIPATVADDVVGLLRQDVQITDDDVTRPLQAGDVAILVGRHKDAAAVQDALRARGVPCVRYGQSRVFASPEALDMEALLDAWAHPNDTRRVRAALVGPLFGHDAAQLHALDEDETREQEQLLRFRRWRDVWSQRGIMRAFDQVVSDTGAMQRLRPLPGGERVLTNLRHLAELLHAAEQEQRLGTFGLLHWLREQRSEEGTGSDEEAVRLESDARAVQIVTMHSSKGLQYPVVFCPYLWVPDYLAGFPEFHDTEADGQATLQLHPEAHPDHEATWAAERRAEKLRLAYVALTRAKHLCVVTAGKLGAPNWNFTTTPLAHLFHPHEGAPWAHADALRKADPGELRSQLEALAAASGGRIAVSDVAPPGHDTWVDGSVVELLQEAATPRRGHGADLRLSSFTGLVRSLHDAAHDHDRADPDLAVPDATRADPEVDAPPLTLEPWPRGAQAGTAYHAAFEGLPFHEPDSDAAAAHVAEQLQRHGHTEPAAVAAVQRSVAEVCATPLLEGAPALGAIGGKRFDELGFTMRVGATTRPLAPRALAEVFAAHGPPAVGDRVAARLRRLSPQAIEGALTGFIDLAFEHDGRWYVVDYKTNFLGDTAADYAPDRVADAMVEGDYVLQYHLYLVALVRWLTLRKPGFDVAEHVGGARYLFVRGMHPDHPPGTGVFVDRPSVAMLRALDAVLEGDV